MVVEVIVTTKSHQYRSDDLGWQDQVAVLYRELREQVGTMRLSHSEQGGTRGSIAEVVIALSSSSVLLSAVTCLRHWLSMSRTRRVSVRWTDADGSERSLMFEGAGFDEAAFKDFTVSVGRLLEDR